MLIKLEKMLVVKKALYFLGIIMYNLTMNSFS